MGRTTLYEEMDKQLNASVILADNFYSDSQSEEWAPRTAKKTAEGAIDWRRMRAEALEPLLHGKVAEWHTSNWGTGIGLSEEKITCKSTPIIILDGAFYTRPELSDIVDLSVLVELP